MNYALSIVPDFSVMAKRGTTQYRPPNFKGEENPTLEGTPFLALAEVEKRHILRVYEAMKKNKTSTARVLEVDVKTLYNKLRKYGIHP